jgi:hypothetical protein
MAETITPINPAPGQDTFQIWVDRTNLLINVASNRSCTVNTHANGGLTTGNGFVAGNFGASNLVCSIIRGGTVQTPAVMTVSSNVNVTGDKITVGTVVINSSGISVGGTPIISGRTNITADTSGTTAQLVDSFDKILYRAAEYTLSVKDQNANAYQLSKFLVIHDTGQAYVSEYSVLISNNNQGIFAANVDATTVRVYLTPTSTNSHVSGSRSIINV